MTCKLAYPECVRYLYGSEVNGEAIFSALFKVAHTDRDRYHFGTLLQLETETKARLRPLLFKHHIAFSEPKNLQPIVDGSVALYLEKGLQGFVAAAREVTASELARFAEIAKLGPVSDQAVLNGMVRHEAAILKWIDAERLGESETSLDDVVAQLAFPLQRGV